MSLGQPGNAERPGYAAPAIGPGAVVLVFGYGLHGQAVATALTTHGIEVLVADDRPTTAAVDHATALGVEMLSTPDSAALRGLLLRATVLVPTPGLPDGHPVHALAAAAAVPTIGEFDLAAAWDQRPIVAVTGTNGKTTVTTMITDMLCRSGRTAITAGNMEVPLVSAIDDEGIDVFVVEASSFRLGHSASFAPTVATWLNFDPDHLDVHESLEAYEAAKARIWAALPVDGVAIANTDDPVVMRNVPRDRRVLTFGSSGDASVRDGRLMVQDVAVIARDDLPRTLPHDISNSLAAATTALAAGANVEAVRGTLRSFAGLAHRVELVAEADGVRWYDDSKATTPHAVVAGLGGFESAVLIAGGRNKGVDLSPLRTLAPRLRGVVAIGEAASEVADVFGTLVPVMHSESMTDAVATAATMAQVGDVVVLSPACTSYDWYRSYGERGDHYAAAVRALLGDRTSEGASS